MGSYLHLMEESKDCIHKSLEDSCCWNDRCIWITVVVAVQSNNKLTVAVAVRILPHTMQLPALRGDYPSIRYIQAWTSVPNCRLLLGLWLHKNSNGCCNYFARAKRSSLFTRTQLILATVIRCIQINMNVKEAKLFQLFKARESGLVLLYD